MLVTSWRQNKAVETWVSLFFVGLKVSLGKLGAFKRIMLFGYFYKGFLPSSLI